MTLFSLFKLKEVYVHKEFVRFTNQAGEQFLDHLVPGLWRLAQVKGWNFSRNGNVTEVWL